MFLDLSHTKLDIFQVSRKFTLACYKQTISFPAEEKYGMTSRIRRAALSVHLNIAEGCSGKSVTERKRFYEIARGSIIEIDAALDIAKGLNYTKKEKLTEPGDLLSRWFQMLSKMIR